MITLKRIVFLLVFITVVVGCPVISDADVLVGRRSATLTWYNPSTSVGGGELTDLASVEVWGRFTEYDYDTPLLILDVDTTEAGGTIIRSTNLPYDGTVKFLLIAVDLVGNRSADSELSEWWSVEIAQQSVLIHQ